MELLNNSIYQIILFISIISYTYQYYKTYFK